MADKYINAEVFKRKIQTEMDKEKALQPMDTVYHIFLDMIYDLIEKSVDEMSASDIIERKNGKWEEKEVFDAPVVGQWQSARCSICDLYHTTPFSYYFTDYKYCPYCGAEMREEESNDGK